jgi:hypothetical protein
MELPKFLFMAVLGKLTSTILYITSICIAGCQYNFIYITRILFNFANNPQTLNNAPQNPCYNAPR